MIRYKITRHLFCGLLFFLFFSGIYRHDVDVNEYLSLAKEPQFDCVGQIYKDTIPEGSCVLIHEKYVLTAAHVLIDEDMRPDTIEVDGIKIIAYQYFNARETDVDELLLFFNDKKVKAKRIILHPNYLDTQTQGSCDLAIIELEEPLRDIAPAILNRNYDELNSVVVGVGFGVSGPANRPDLVAPHNKKIAGENVIDSIAGFKYSGKGTLLFADFDHPKDTLCCNKMGSPEPRPLEYIPSGGDSGGGLFRQKNGKWELIGICSGYGTNVQQLIKSGYYGQIMGWTRVSVLIDWIEEQTK
ncbi:MAG: trypsin-like serine protease [Bacteroidota bacterium]|nr:trypsin-like serine protease [Bacteroidota bacterium]